MEGNPLTAIASILNQGGATLYVILLCSVILVTLVLERAVYYHRKGSGGESLYNETAQFLENGRMSEGAANLQGRESSFAEIYSIALAREGLPREQVEKAIATAISRETLGFERNLAYIGTLAVISPFIGLLGTVLGIMQAFQDIATKGATGPAVVAKGVAEALIATAAGLFVAIPASFFFNYFKNRQKFILSQMKIGGSRLAEVLSLRSEGKPLPDDLKGSPAVEKNGRLAQQELREELQ